MTRKWTVIGWMGEALMFVDERRWYTRWGASRSMDRRIGKARWWSPMRYEVVTHSELAHLRKRQAERAAQITRRPSDYA